MSTPERAKIEDQLERWIGLSHSSVEANMLASIAISMKRIADKMSPSTRADLLAAAKGIITAFGDDYDETLSGDDNAALRALRAAIAAIEEPAS